MDEIVTRRDEPGSAVATRAGFRPILDIEKAGPQPTISLRDAAVEDDGFTTVFPVGGDRAGEPDDGSPSARRYRVVRPHARGGLGEVFVAHDEELNRRVALKALQDRHADDPATRARFVLEAEITGSLEHPGIVPVYGLGHYPDGRPFYAMRFIRGDSLRDAIARFHGPGGPRGDARAVELRRLLGRFLDVCNAIDYAHSRGVLHRDLKPGNIMLGPFGETLVVDWGLAKPLGGEAPRRSPGKTESKLRPRAAGDTTETLAGSTVGTPQYMSPEQADGRIDELGLASDVYSLGATLSCLLTGTPPVEGKDLAEVLARVRRGEVVRPRQVCREVPEALEAICLKAMALRPEGRYESPRALAEDVERWMADEPVTAWREPLRVRGRRWFDRHRTLVLCAGAALVAATIGLLAIVAVERQAKSRLVVANDAEKAARALAEVERRQVEVQTASLDLERGQAMADGGEVGLGMLWMARGLALADRARDADLGRAIRANLAHYRPRLHAVRVVHPPGPAGFAPDGRTYALRRGEATLELWDLAGGRLVGALAHPPALRSWAYSPDGRLLATAGDDGVARLWGTADARPAGRTPTHAGAIESVAFRPDGAAFLTVAGRAVRLFRAGGGPLRPPIPHDGPVVSAGFGPDGSFFTRQSHPDRIRLFGPRGGPVGRPIVPPGAVRSVAFAPTGRSLLVASDDGTARLYRVADARPIGDPLPHASPIAPGYSPDGGRVWSAIDSRSVQLGDAEDARPASPLIRLPEPVEEATFAPDGRALLLRWGGRRYGLWDVADGRPIGEPWAGDHSPFARFHPDGSRLLVTSPDGVAHLRDARTGRPVAQLWNDEALKSMTSAAFSPDGRALLTGEYRLGYLRDAATGRPISEPLEFTGPVTRAAFSPDGRHFVTETAAEGVQVREADAVARLGLSLPQPHTVASVAYRPDGRAVATTSRVETMLWDAGTGKPLGEALPSTGPVPFVEFGPGGRWLLTAVPGGAAIADPETGTARVELPGVRLLDAAFDPKGRFVVITDGRQARCWDPETGRPIGRAMPHETDQPYTCLAISPDGTIAATIDGQRIRLWDLPTGGPRGEPLEHPDAESIFAVAFGPDGRTLATGFRPGGGRLWDLATGRAIASLPHQGLCEFVAYAPDGETLLTGGQDRAVQAWDAASGRPIGEPLRLTGGAWRVVPSPDGRLFATLTYDGPQANAVRLWDRATGKPVGPPLTHQDRVFMCAFGPGGRTLLTGSLKEAPSRIWRLPSPIRGDGDARRVALWVETITGMELGANHGVRILGHDDWRRRRDELEKLGGPPLDEP